MFKRVANKYECRISGNAAKYPKNEKIITPNDLLPDTDEDDNSEGYKDERMNKFNRASQQIKTELNSQLYNPKGGFNNFYNW